jgi:hypothetical protein
MPNLTAINQTSPPDPTTTDSIPGDFNEFDFLDIELGRAGVLQQNLELQGEDIKKNNALLSDLQGALKLVDAATPADASQDGGYNINVSKDVYDMIESDPSISQYVPESGSNGDGTYWISSGDGGATKMAAWLKDTVQQFSNNSQMDMIQLQSQMNNLNQVMQTATSVMQKASDTKDKILQNIH